MSSVHGCLKGLRITEPKSTVRGTSGRFQIAKSGCPSRSFGPQFHKIVGTIEVKKHSGVTDVDIHYRL